MAEDNNLTTLKGSPINVYGNFNCNNNQLLSLEGAPTNIDRDFLCTNNKNLTKEEIIKYKNTVAVKGKIFSDYGQF